jgi:hypothetical protein
VVDYDNTPVPSLSASDFTYNIFDPSGSEVSSTVNVTITEMTSGGYRASYTPISKGKWFLVLYNDDYFPWGKAGETKVYDNDIDSVAVEITRALGLMQENYYLDQIVLDSNDNMTSGRIRIYSNSADVGSNNSVIATYQVTATWSNATTMTSYKVVKV